MFEDRIIWQPSIWQPSERWKDVLCIFRIITPPIRGHPLISDTEEEGGCTNKNARKEYNLQYSDCYRPGEEHIDDINVIPEINSISGVRHYLRRNSITGVEEDDYFIEHGSDLSNDYEIRTIGGRKVGPFIVDGEPALFLKVSRTTPNICRKCKYRIG